VDRLRIAQVAPLSERVPPLGYGGTERVISYLTEELVRQGHEVTLFASGDSCTTARLVPVCKRSLRLESGCIDQLAHHLVMVEQVYRQAAEFDLIHFHIDYLHFAATRRQRMPTISTMHGRLDIPDLVPLFREYPDMPVVSISDAQRQPLPWLDWRATVYHGLPPGAFPFHPGAARAGRKASASGGSGYLAFLGRASPEKGLDAAIEIARRAGLTLRIGAKVERADQEYFEREIQPLLRPPHVEYLGEIGAAEKLRLLGGADALLFPVDWPEPFGLVMIEAMACGTPVIARGRGSVPEVMADPRSGFVCSSIDEAVAAVGRLPELTRHGCRQAFEDRFTASRMVEDYVRVYRALLEAERDTVA
jgi:glycosyltransferase involved in cell wall biosynthesis